MRLYIVLVLCNIHMYELIGGQVHDMWGHREAWSI